MPNDGIEEYNLHHKATKDGYVYVSVFKGMYDLPQSRIIAQKLPEERLGKEGYEQSQFTPGLWSHKWRPVQFSLMVDDFRLKYIGKEHAEHLVRIIQKHYEMTMDWEGIKYCGLTLEWDYVKREVHFSMPGPLTMPSNDSTI